MEKSWNKIFPFFEMPVSPQVVKMHENTRNFLLQIYLYLTFNLSTFPGSNMANLFSFTHMVTAIMGSLIFERRSDADFYRNIFKRRK